MRPNRPNRDGTRAARGRGLAAGVLLAAGWVAAPTGPAVLAAPPGWMNNQQQQMNPVYVDDSPAAADTFVRVREHVSAGNLDEAVRILQVLLDEQPDRLIASAGDPDLFINVRAAVHDLLLSTPKLLERYRAAFGPRADRLLGEGQTETVERSLLLTPSGFDAATRLAQNAFEDARFEQARLLLEQLEKHPDRTGNGERARQASQSLNALAKLLDRPELRDLAARWAREAGMGMPDLTPEPWPAPAKARPATTFDALLPTDTRGIVSKPLWTVPLNPTAPAPEAMAAGGGRATVSVPLYARDLLLLPTVSGDTVYINDGSQIGAWDRFTLAQRWAVAPGAGETPAPESGIRGRGRMERNFGFPYAGRTDDLCTVAVSGRYVVAATGRSTASRTDGDDRVQALDAQTGRLRWYVQLNTLEPPTLYEAAVRGPIQIVEGKVVFAARKHLPDRRLVSLALVGLDLATGRLEWLRPIGSAGSMPWVLQSMGADGASVADGLVYRADRLGVVGAVECGTGRTRWIRRMPVDTSSNADQPSAWQMNAPVIDGATLLTISPDARRIIRMDRATGAVIAHRDVADFSPATPHYLLRVGEWLACVGDDRVAFVHTATFDSDRPAFSAQTVTPGIRGRCVVTGDRLLIPSLAGCTLVDPAHPGEGQPMPLEETGNVLPLDSQLVVVDDMRVHSYLQWDVAERLLTERISQDPKDPTPAVTYAELAYRAAKPEKLVSAVQAAMSALKLGPQNDSTWTARARLIEALQGILATALEPPSPSAGGSLPKAPPGVKPITDRALLEQLVSLLGELSFQPEDKLAHTLALGRLSELKDKPDDAVAAYQRVLSDPPLAGATWRGPQVSIRGELEAARRIEGLLKQHGPAIYAGVDQQAASDLAALGDAPTELQLETLVARYPIARIAPGVWMRISDLRAADNKPQLASSALEAGLRAAARHPAPPADVVGEIAGRLIASLRERQQVAAAAGVLRMVRAKFPALALTAQGHPLDAEKLGAELAQKIAASMRWPRVGPIRADGGQAIVGWTLMEPLLTDRAPTVTTLLPMVSDDEVGLWAVPTTGSTGPDLLVKAWSQQIGDAARATLIRTTADAAYFAIVKEGDVSIVKVAGSPLALKWKADGLAKTLTTGEGRLRNLPGARAAVEIPAEGSTAPTNLVLAMDERTLVLVQRTGLALALDTDTGETLWHGRTGIGVVHDVDLSGGTLAVGGSQEIMGKGNQVAELRPAIQLLDARTGRQTQRLSDFGSGAPGLPGGSAGAVRWIGFADTGAAPALIAALDSAVVCIDLASTQANWTITHQDAMPVSAMWIFGDQLVMADQSRSLWLASISTGRLRAAPLDMPRSHIESTQTMDAFPVAAATGSGFGVATQQGLALFSADGSLTGVDGMDGSAAMIRPRPADGRALTIETIADGRASDGMMMFALHALDVAGPTGAALIDSRPILLGARPSAMTLLDERVAVTAGNVTVVLHAPVGK